MWSCWWLHSGGRGACVLPQEDQPEEEVKGKRDGYVLCLLKNGYYKNENRNRFILLYRIAIGECLERFYHATETQDETCDFSNHHEWEKWEIECDN